MNLAGGGGGERGSNCMNLRVPCSSEAAIAAGAGQGKGNMAGDVGGMGLPLSRGSMLKTSHE